MGIRTVSGIISPWPIVFGGAIISAPGSRAQAFQIFRFRQVQVDRLHSRLQLRWRCQGLRLTCRLRSGLVRLLASNFGNVPGGFGTTGPATLWFSFSPWAGATPSLFLLRWPFQTCRCSASGRVIRVGLLQDFRWGQVDSNKWVGQ